MTRNPTHDRDPWRSPVIVAQIPDGGLHRDIKADAGVRAAMARIAGLRDVLAADASFDVRPKRDGQIQVTGRVHARVGQTCVVTLDPIENVIDEEIDLTFAPPEQIPEMADLVDDDGESEIDMPDPPEPILNGLIDLGRVATDALFLAIDPYPRKPGAVFEPKPETEDPEEHPFARLKDLKLAGQAPPGQPGDGSKGRK